MSKRVLISKVLSDNARGQNMILKPWSFVEMDITTKFPSIKDHIRVFFSFRSDGGVRFRDNMWALQQKAWDLIEDERERDQFIDFMKKVAFAQEMSLGEREAREETFKLNNLLYELAKVSDDIRMSVPNVNDGESQRLASFLRNSEKYSSVLRFDPTTRTFKMKQGFAEWHLKALSRTKLMEPYMNVIERMANKLSKKNSTVLISEFESGEVLRQSSINEAIDQFTSALKRRNLSLVSFKNLIIVYMSIPKELQCVALMDKVRKLSFNTKDLRTILMEREVDGLPLKEMDKDTLVMMSAALADEIEKRLPGLLNGHFSLLQNFPVYVLQILGEFVIRKYIDSEEDFQRFLDMNQAFEIIKRINREIEERKDKYFM